MHAFLGRANVGLAGFQRGGGGVVILLGHDALIGQGVVALGGDAGELQIALRLPDRLASTCASAALDCASVARACSIC